MNDKNQNIIKAKYYTKKGLIKEGKFNSNSTFGQILDYFKKNNKNIFFKLKPKYIFNGEIVKNNQLISKLIHIDKNCSLKYAEIWIEINNESNDNKTGEQDIIQKKILKPTKNPFSIIVITPSKDSISLEKYPEYTTKKFDLYDFNYTSAYCNSPNFLFISGGEQNSRILDNFWIIEHVLYSIEQKKMPYPKKNHSMIYIEEGLVYIVGGNTNTTFFYDLEKDEFIKCGNLIHACQEPTLLRINDFIYCLSSLKNKNFFERIKITRMSGNWEKINVFISPEIKIEFINNSFGALNMGDGNIIICGGNNASENSFTFNYFSHTLIKNEEKNENIELGDKRLYPIDNNYYIGISKYFEENKEIIIINKKTKKLKKIKCNKTQIIDNNFNDIKIKQDEENDKEEDLNGSVSVNAIINRKGSKGVFTIKNLGPNLEDKFEDFLKEQKEFVENNLRNNNKEEINKEINHKINNEISSKKKIDDLSDNLGFLEVKVINPINDKNIKNIKNKNLNKNYGNIFVKETNLKFGESYDKDDEDEDEEEEEEEEEYFCNNFQYNISENCSESNKTGKDKENYNAQMNKKINQKKNEEIIFDRIDKDNFEEDKLNNKQYNNDLEKSIENILEIKEENNGRNKEEENIEIKKEKINERNKEEYIERSKEEKNEITKEENIERNKEENNEGNKEENNEGNKEENNEKNKQEYDNNPINNNINDEQPKNEKNDLLELKKEEIDNENNIDKQKEKEKENENEKEHKEKYDNLRKNILDFQSTSDMYALSQNHLAEISPEKDKTNNENKESSEIKNKNANNNSPSVAKQLNDSSDISDFKYYQNRLEHFEKKFNINYKNEKCQNKIDASNKINKQKLISVFTPVVNRTRYPKIESSSPYCSLRLKEEGFIVNPTNSEENPNPMYNSLKESNINDGYSSIYEKILKNQEDGINLPVIDSSKIYQFQK